MCCLVLYIELKINSIRYGRKNVRYSIRYRYDIDIRYFDTIRSDNDNEAEKATWTADSILCYRFCCASCILAMLSVRYIVNAPYYHHIQHLYALKISSFAGSLNKYEQERTRYEVAFPKRRP